MGIFSKKDKQAPVTNPVLQEMQAKNQVAAQGQPGAKDMEEEFIKIETAAYDKIPAWVWQESENILHQVMLQPNDLSNLPVWSWVWIECYSQFDNPLQQSAYYRKIPTSSGNPKDTLFCGYPGCIFGFNYATYGIDWVAYKYQP